jgi:hypothetical protein
MRPKRTVNGSQEDIMIPPHRTGHAFAADGHLLRVDVMSGQWVASRSAPNLVLKQEVFGTTEFVHQQIARWLSPEGLY